MAELKERLRADLTTSIKGRQQLRSSTLRMVLAAITNAEVAGKQARELSDDEVQAVIASEAKKRRESAEAFTKGGRHELAEKETAEAAILADYLPEQMSADEIAAVVAEVVAQTGTAGEGNRAMGTVMGAVQPRVKGRADGAAVAAEVRRQLGG
ncbi:GatB/YqeY domain-containing protein [soil metagenome]